MFVSTLVIHCAYLVTLHWSFYLVNSSETEIPKADSFSSAFNNKIAELFFGFLNFVLFFLKEPTLSTASKYGSNQYLDIAQIVKMSV